MNDFEQENEQIRQSISIVDLFDSAVGKLRKLGNTYRALCPFHDEKSPSFHIFPKTNSFYCFGCNESGDVFKFVMLLHGSDFRTAKEFLAERAGIEIKPFGGSRSSSTQSAQNRYKEIELEGILKEALAYYRGCLMNNLSIKEYVAKRGLNPDHLGLAKDRRIQTLVNVTRVDPEVLVQAGLVQTDGEGKYWPTFIDRIIVPIYNSRNNLVSLAGRSIPSIEKIEGVAKWKNGPNTLLFKKGRELFGLSAARRMIYSEGQVVIVEGYFDTLVMQANGIANTVGLMGTAINEDHFKILARIKPGLRVYIMLDGDKAGRAATRLDKLAELMVKAQVYGHRLYIVTLPEGKDPDEMVLEDREGLTQLILSSPSAMNYYWRLAESRAWPQTDSDVEAGKLDMVKLMSPVIGQLTNENERDLFLTRLSQRTGFDFDRLEMVITSAQYNPERGNSDAYLDLLKGARKQPGPPRSNENLQDLIDSYEAALLRSLIAGWPDSMGVFGNDDSRAREADFSIEVYCAIFRQLEEAHQFLRFDSAFSISDLTSLLEARALEAEGDEAASAQLIHRTFLKLVSGANREYGVLNEGQVAQAVRHELHQLRGTVYRKVLNDINGVIMASEDEQEIEELAEGAEAITRLWEVYQ